MVVDILRWRPAAENPPLSTTRTKVVRLVRRSIGCLSQLIIQSYRIILLFFPELSHRAAHCIFASRPHIAKITTLRRSIMKSRMNFYQAAPDTLKALMALE